MTKLFGKGPNIFTVPAGADFLTALSDGLDNIEAELGFAAPEVTLFLPNQRSIRAFQGHLMKQSGGKSKLLPILKPIGKPEEDDILIGALAILPDDLDLPPAISTNARKFWLQLEIKKLGKSTGLGALSCPERLMLAGELGRLLDQMQNAGLAFDKLETLAPETYAHHWQEILAFLKIVSRTWPSRLKELGLMDPVARRILLIKRLIKTWQINPPQTPVIAAGSTGSVPITRELLKAISKLPRGLVLLPGLDREMDIEAWDFIEESHPQFVMKTTLEALNLNRGKVPDWPLGLGPGKNVKTRLDFFRKAMVPAPITAGWHKQKFDQRAVAKSLSVVECPQPQAEAGVIALILRETLEFEDKTAALVTPDRGLAERVREELQRWNLEVDDSAGVALLTTPPGAFFNLLTEMVGSNFSPVPLLAFLKHPLTTLGMGRETLLKLARTLDRKILRGVAPGSGLPGLEKKISAAKKLPEKTALLGMLKTLSSKASVLAKLLHKNPVSFSKVLKAHIDAVIVLSLEFGGENSKIWFGSNGEILGKFLKDLGEDAPALGKIDGAEYPGILRALMEGPQVRRPFSNHPRLFIWGTLEARLQNPDLVILGGLNEGTWPPEGTADPWMSREMRSELGLPTPDFRVGQSAHDFYLAAGAKEVVLTRSKKVAGTPTTPSRWIQRAQALMGGKLPGGRHPWLAWFGALEQPEETVTLLPPTPRPPVRKRPTGLSVTNIEKLVHDPYSIFAKYILKVKPLEDLEADPGAADKGLLLHKIFEVFFRENNFKLPENPLDALLDTGNRIFEEQGFTRPAIKAFWWPRFREVAGAFIHHQKTREGTYEIAGAEVKGFFDLEGAKQPFRVTATADRVDRKIEGSGLYIIDYKSGVLPSGADMARGKKPQLPLEAVIAEEGGFKDIKAGAVAGLEFWNVGKPGVKLEIKATSKDLETTILAARAGLLALINHFAEEKNPYLAVPDPSGHRFGDYDPLSRYHEWQNQVKSK
ncbi:MAG: double-strand break repair protein AddB [Sphingomonadales bacterium]